MTGGPSPDRETGVTGVTLPTGPSGVTGETGETAVDEFGNPDPARLVTPAYGAGIGRGPQPRKCQA